MSRNYVSVFGSEGDYAPAAGGGLPVTRDANGGSAEVIGTVGDYASLTIGVQANRALILHVCYSDDPGAVTLNWDSAGANQALTLIDELIGPGTRRVRLYGLLNPVSGNKNLHGTIANSGIDWAWNATSYYNVDQTSIAAAFHNVAKNSGTSTTASVTVTSAVGEMTNDVFTAGVGSATPSQTLLYFLSPVGPDDSGASEGTGAASVTHNWTIASAAWSSMGCSIKAA